MGEESRLEIRIESDHTDEILQMADEAISQVLETVGMQASNYARLQCPVDTGLLRNSITYALAGDSAAIGDYSADHADKNGNMKSGSYSGTAPNEQNSVFVGSNVEYAKYVEEGTSRHPEGAHFLRQAVQDHADEYRRMFEDALRNA